MAELTYRAAFAAGIAQEMDRDETVVLIGEDVGAAGGVFKLTEGLIDRFGPERVRDTPISEQAIVGAAMGAAMTGLRPIAELMFSDFFAVTWDMVANQIAKTRYMTDGQVSLPLVLRTANGAGLRFGAQHSQSVENWAMAIPGLKVVAPSTPRDAKALLKASIRDENPVVFLEHKRLYSLKGEPAEPDEVAELGRAAIVRPGRDLTIATAMKSVHDALAAADELARDGIEAEVVDLRTLRPLDRDTVIESVTRTNRLLVVEEGPRTGGWAGGVVGDVAEHALEHLDDVWRLTTDDSPIPYSPPLEDAFLPSAERIAASVREHLATSTASTGALR
jgi:pyruvate dehydrogenase E1 component beta subunit